MTTNTQLITVAGTQYGSEGKGHVTLQAINRAIEDHESLRQRARRYGVPRAVGAHELYTVRVGGPNAGHCVIDPNTGHKYAFRTLPVGLVLGTNKYTTSVTGVISPGSEIDLDVLENEVRELLQHGAPNAHYTLYIDQSATLLTREHISQEKTADLTARLGSTAKGIGAARADRIWRTATTIGQLLETPEDHPHHGYRQQLERIINTDPRFQITIRDTVGHVLAAIKNAKDPMCHICTHVTAVIEGTQGYGLGLHTSAYPKCTSNDTRPIDFQAMAGLSPTMFDSSLNIGVVRPNPIRVAGNSGPLKGETTWEELEQDPEYTTVTQKVRRVGEWDPELVREAVIKGAIDVVALTMVDKILTSVRGAAGDIGPNTHTTNKTTAALLRVAHHYEEQIGVPVTMMTTSENTCVFNNEGA